MVCFRNSSTDIQCELHHLGLVLVSDYAPVRWQGGYLTTSKLRGRPPPFKKIQHRILIFHPTALRFNGSNYGRALATVSMAVRILHPHIPRDSSFVFIGQCILTVGTDDRPLADREGVKLLPSHCYPVMGSLLHSTR